MALAAEPDPTLRRSDRIDVRRLDKVSEDERSVLRIEWRAGLTGVEETRSIEEMLDKLRRMETGISEVDRLVRNMPAQNPVVAATPTVAAEAPESSGHDIRLVAANLAALALVAIWWFGRRKSATRPDAGRASAPGKVLPGVALPPATPAPPVTAALTITPPSEASLGAPAALAQQPVAVTAARSGDKPAGREPLPSGGTPAAAPDPGPVESAEPVATASFNPQQPEPSKPLPANETMIVDFSPEEADLEVAAREKAELQAPPPVSAPQSPPTAHETNVEPTLHLAEIMLSMGLEAGAAQALNEYIEANPRHAVYHWLKLLGIYRSRGLQKQFAETAEKLRKHFNIQAEEWGKPAAGGVPGLESFSRISEHVQKIWTQPEECLSYLEHLLQDNREGARAGFPQSVAEEILFLVEILKHGQA